MVKCLQYANRRLTSKITVTKKWLTFGDKMLMAKGRRKAASCEREMRLLIIQIDFPTQTLVMTQIDKEIVSLLENSLIIV